MSRLPDQLLKFQRNLRILALCIWPSLGASRYWGHSVLQTPALVRPGPLQKTPLFDLGLPKTPFCTKYSKIVGYVLDLVVFICQGSCSKYMKVCRGGFKKGWHRERLLADKTGGFGLWALGAEPLSPINAAQKY